MIKVFLAVLFITNLILASDLKILIVTGGHDFEEEAFFEMFDDFEEINYKVLSHPDANNAYLSDSIKAFDAIVYYDMVNEITEEQKAGFINLLEDGIGVVFLHHSLAGYQDWDEYEKIIGGRFYHESRSDTTGITLSTYRHDVEIPVTIADRNHSVTNGLKDFVIYDEVYGSLKILPDVHPLLKTNHSESSEVIAWTNEYGNSKIVYIQSGQDHNAYDNPNYRQLVMQALEWVAN